MLWSDDGAGVIAEEVEACLSSAIGVRLVAMGHRQPGQRRIRRGMIYGCNAGRVWGQVIWMPFSQASQWKLRITRKYKSRNCRT